MTCARSRSGGRAAYAIVTAGLLAGILDISAAFVLAGARGVAPGRVLQGIASGVLGAAAFTGAGATAALGLLLHFVIALGAATAFYLASRVWRPLLRRPIIFGLLYGVAVYAIMNRIVLPLSLIEMRTQPWDYVAILIVIHVLCVGLPISLTIARLSKRAGTGSPDLATR